MVTRMKKTYKLATIFTILVLLLVILFYKGQPKTLYDQFKLWKTSMDNTKEFMITDVSKSSFTDKIIIEISAQKFGENLKIRKIENMDKQDADTYIDEKRFETDSLFYTVPSPYPDVITQIIVCPDEFHPIINETEDKDRGLIFYILYAGERFNYGVCSEDLIRYKSILAFIYCKDKEELYQVELFTPVDEFNQTSIDMIESFRC